MINNEETILQFGYSYERARGCDLVAVNCQYCGKGFSKKKSDCKKVEKSRVSKMCCSSGLCKGQKIKEVGEVDPTVNIRKAETFKNTCLERYGETNHQFSPEQREKQRKRIENMTPEEMAERNEKMAQTNLKRRNVRVPIQCPLVKASIQNTNLERYNAKSPMGNSEILQKALKSRSKKSGVATSRQQKYLNLIYQGIINQNILNYYSDILFSDNVICEYDGGGHDLCVTLGSSSREDFNEKEERRHKELRDSGYKIFRIVSNQDKLPLDSTLKKMLNAARDVFNILGKDWITFDIDKGVVEWEDVQESYYFGPLRRIKQKDIENTSNDIHQVIGK